MNSGHNLGRNLPPERKGIYYLGMTFLIIGFLGFISTFFSVGASMTNPMGPVTNMIQTLLVRSVGGILFMILGGVLMNVGARGAAGSGVVLDPERARKDLEPWSRMAGGMVKDALDEADIDRAIEPPGEQLTFDEKLRRLEQLRREGLITEEEYQAKRKEFLAENW